MTISSRREDSSWIRRILLATDFSRGAGYAKDYAAFLARHYEADVDLLHVAQPYPTLAADAVADPYLLEPIRQSVSSALDELAAALAETGVRAAASHVVGIPSEEIVRAAREHRSDLIAMGTQGRTGLDYVLVGSTAERVVRTAPCPVLTVRPLSRPAQDGVGVRRLLVPCDFYQPSIDALETAALLARRLSAPMTLLHVLEWAWIRSQYSVGDLTEEARVRKDVEARLDRYTAPLRALGIAVDASILGGAGPVDHIVETAERQGAGLVVMGTHGRRGLRRALMGSVAEGVLRHAPCPVLTVHTPRFAPGYQRLFPPIEDAA